MLSLGRLITAMVSPFSDDGRELDEARLRTLVQHCVATGSDSILVGGTTGEGPTLTQSEFLTLVREARHHAPAQVPIMANVGTNDTRGSINRAIAAQETGANSLLVVCPYYNKPPQRGLIAHFEAIAEVTPLPIMIYNIPGRTAVNMLPATVATIAQRCPTVVAIKEASGDLEQMSAVIDAVAATGRTDFHLWSGDDGITAEVMRRGGVGVVSVISQVVGLKLKALIEAAASGDHASASVIQREIDPLAQAAFITTNPIGIKTMLNAIGIAVGGVRLPLVPPTEEERAILEAAVMGM